MPPSSPPPDRFQREIDDIIRLAERRLEKQSFGYRVRRSTRRFGGVFGGLGFRFPPPEVMAGYGLALLLLAMVLSLLRVLTIVAFWAQVIGLALLATAIVVSVSRGRRGGGSKLWRGERVYYSPYGDGLLGRLRRLFRRQ